MHLKKNFCRIRHNFTLKGYRKNVVRLSFHQKITDERVWTLDCRLNVRHTKHVWKTTNNGSGITSDIVFGTDQQWLREGGIQYRYVYFFSSENVYFQDDQSFVISIDWQDVETDGAASKKLNSKSFSTVFSHVSQKYTIYYNLFY